MVSCVEQSDAGANSGQTRLASSEQPNTAARDTSIRDLSIGTLWGALVDPEGLESALAWPPDVLVLVDRVLEMSEAYRFLVSPPPGLDFVDEQAIANAGHVAREWLRWLDGDGSQPTSLSGLWDLICQGQEVTLQKLSDGSRWDMIEALLVVHAIADEACAGLGTASAAAPGPGCGFRAAARELLAERGSLSRLSPEILRALPRCRTPTSGISISSLSRFVSVRGPQVDVEWHRMLSRPPGVERPSAHANVVLLPWPLRVRSRDFQPLSYSLSNMDPTEFGFFEFRPDETLDLDLVDQVLWAAKDEAGSADIVVLPEAAITPPDIAPLEKLLGDHGVWCLIAGVRESASDGRLGSNFVHVGALQEMVWRHANQSKHHRWCLDERQINQYHLGGSLTPTMRWWEAISIPRRSLQVIDMGAITLIPLLCEDLARLEPVADLVRAIGPSLVMTLLLDGPQLASRWIARYASVLADDPGSAVCTFTAYGMAQRCRPPGCQASRVIGLWKEASGRQIEIELEEGADAVLVSTNVTQRRSYTADGRCHPGTTSDLTLVAVRPLYARDRSSRTTDSRPSWSIEQDPPTMLPQFADKDLTKLTSWLEAMAEAVVVDSNTLARVISEATGTDWRLHLGLPAPSPLLEEAIAVLQRELPHPTTLAGLLEAADRLYSSEDPTAILGGFLLRIAIEERLVAEVRGGRMDVGSLDVLTAHSH
jgi:hypothetical protein